MMNVQDAVKKLNQLEEMEFAYSHAMGMLSYDGVTGAPKNSGAPRAKTMGILTGEMRKLSGSDDAINLLGYLRDHFDELSPEDKRRVERREKGLREIRAIPVEEAVAHSELLSGAADAWREAKEKSDYSIFEPYLGKIIENNKRFAKLVAPDMDPYDYCLDKYEEGLTMAKCDEFFAALRERIVPLIAKVQATPQPDNAVTQVHFPAHKQRELSAFLMNTIGMDRNCSTIAETEHPFTTNFSKYDVRITTKYDEDYFPAAMFSTVHEGGHALYEMHTDSKYTYTSLDGGVSMGVHESQSRFFENVLGRSREFCTLIFPELQRLCPEMEKFTAEDLYKAANRVNPSLIRIEADEVTYSLHIMVRYEMEKAIMAGDIPTKDLPGMWNDLYKKYLGVTVPDDRNGILQDVHWSQGSIGYFPSYALGSAYAAQLLNKMQETVDVYGCVSAGDISPVNSWLCDRIWRYASMEKPTTLIEKAMEAPFDPKYYTDYLERKMADVYGV